MIIEEALDDEFGADMQNRITAKATMENRPEIKSHITTTIRKAYG